MIIDSHCHLNDERIYPKREELVKDAVSKGVSFILVPGWDLESSRLAVKIAHEFSECFAFVGFHPENLDFINDEKLKEIADLAKDSKVIGIGEIGLDYHWFKDIKDHEKQKEWFIRQIDLANELNLPISIHARDASEDTLNLLKNHPIKRGAVLHCYSGSSELLKEFSKLGYYFGFDGPVTYKNSITPKENAKICPIDRILIETDSPYLSPIPYRGKDNCPGYVVEIAKAIAELRGMELKDLLEITSENTKRLFHVEQKYE